MNHFAVLVLLATASICSSAIHSKVNDVENRKSRTSEDIKDAPSFRDSLGILPTRDTENCPKLLAEYDPQLVNKISGYQGQVNEIIDLFVNGNFKGETFKELANLVDRYPIRQSGFQNLEDSIDYMMTRMKHYGLQVHDEQVLVPHWVR